MPVAYDLSVYAECAAYRNPYSYLMNNFGTDGIQNFGKIFNAEVDELLDQLALEFDVDRK